MFLLDCFKLLGLLTRVAKQKREHSFVTLKMMFFKISVAFKITFSIMTTHFIFIELVGYLKS
jgi:hypothetical protein